MKKKKKKQKKKKKKKKKKRKNGPHLNFDLFRAYDKSRSGVNTTVPLTTSTAKNHAP